MTGRANFFLLLTLLLPLYSHADFMDADWAAKACEAWNENKILTEQLAEKWIKNDGGRGYKTVRMYRTQCGKDSKVQLTLVAQDGKAMCAYGGLPDDKKFIRKRDYLMHASDKHWTCIGKASFGCGAMGAMMSGKLKFVGPKMEAMSVMEPFGSFLRLTGKIAGEKGPC